MEQRHSPCRDTSSWTVSNDFDEREREVADILVEFYHQVNEYARPQVSVWGAKRKRSVLDETYSPAQAATFPNNSEPLRVQPLRSVPSNSYTYTTMKINDECLRAQPLRTVIPSNDGLFSTGATNLVCHREPNSLVLHLKPMKKPTNKKMRLEEEVADMMKTKDDLSEIGQEGAATCSGRRSHLTTSPEVYAKKQVVAQHTRVVGVKKTEVGYTQGFLHNPSYEDVCLGTSNHSEVVRVHYDPKECSFETLLDVLWARHDPTTLNHQVDFLSNFGGFV
ncbi:hypothetical protein SO802_004059 [Lithocarpus litseifolius]|uniref:peptide-methionine (S)-S-oxide reductase n=1 Tax=Lithocarpus litseifolius TaxID=425828 RepID=A0AAW2E5U0_9ROSI